MNKLGVKPEISVIMSVYNGEEYVAETIESVLCQTFEDWELIIINDCSTDSTSEILSRYAKKDERVKVHTNEVNLRLQASLNKAVSLSQGKYIARIDADDIALPERLEKQYKFMEGNPDISLSTCRFFTLKNGVYSSGGSGGKCDSDSLKAMLLVMNPILHPGVIAKGEVLKRLQYDDSLTCTEDLELWIRMAQENLKMQILPEYLMIYRLHDKQITSTTLERQHKEVVKIEKAYYKNALREMTEEQQEFYISGIYFKENMNTDKLCGFYKWAKAANRKRRILNSEALDYAFFEILAEYRRHGISKTELLKALACFNPFFLFREMKDRKKRAYEDGKRCLYAAEKIGLKQTSGTTEFPIFSKAN